MQSSALARHIKVQSTTISGAAVRILTLGAMQCWTLTGALLREDHDVERRKDRDNE